MFADVPNVPSRIYTVFLLNHKEFAEINQIEWQKECQKICQKVCQNSCQIARKNVSYMPERVLSRWYVRNYVRIMDQGGDLSKKLLFPFPMSKSWYWEHMSNLMIQKVSDVKIFWQDCHCRAWECVSNFITENLTQFVGRTVEAESTVMPASRAWLRDQANELGNSPEDHGIILFLNCPAIGVISAARHSFILNYISNVLADFPLNSICFVVHPNRAQQEGRH